MSNLATAKEALTAYQRWELDSFDAPKQGRSAAILPTAEQLERLHQQAHDEGYAAGMRAGSAQVAAEAARLGELVAALSEQSRVHDQRVAEELLAFGLAISRQVLRQALQAKPELILGVINDVLGQMPLAHQRARLVLNPEDAALVRTSLGEQLKQSGWEIMENAQLSRGGCRLEAAECEIDATLEQRWRRVVGNIGEEHDWIE